MTSKIDFCNRAKTQYRAVLNRVQSEEYEFAGYPLIDKQYGIY
ncbi:MAG: hypothetical protein JWQ66_3871 [Mucilaginibacter sp.]|nr:hypothetical protein [Mucilaginibacter sp.]